MYLSSFLGNLNLKPECRHNHPPPQIELESCNAVQGSCVMPSLSLYILFILIQLSHKMVYVKSHQYNMVSPIHSVGRREMERIALLPP